MNVLMVGSGKMGGAILSRLVQAHVGHITVVDPGAPSVPIGVTLMRHPDNLQFRAFDLIILAVKPQLLDEIVPKYADKLNAKGFFLSIAAGASVDKIRELASNASVVRAMPNLPALIGRSVTGLYAGKGVTVGQRVIAQTVCQYFGSVVWVKGEDGLDKLTAIAGSGPGYIFEFVRVYVEAAKRLGFEDDIAKSLVLETIIGSAEMALSSDQDVVDLRNSVTSKNGTTEAGIKALARDGMLDMLIQNATEAAYQRAKELR